MLQQGYKIDYAAASDAYTFAPEAFAEFFNQRRRWITSTLANQLDLLNDYRNTIKANDNISLLFMIYQLIMTISTILGPATIVLVFVSSFENILNLTLWEAYLLAVIPPALYILACHVCKPKTQIALAGAFSVAYAAVMLVVLVNLIASFVSEQLQDVSLIFVTAVTACFVLAGVLHPYEFSSLLPGFIYYLCIPAGYLILIIYAYANMHVVSWGTREGPKTKEELEALEREKARESKTWWSTLTGNWFAKDIKEFLLQLSNSKANSSETHRQELSDVKKELKKIRKHLTNGHDEWDEPNSLEEVKIDVANGSNSEQNTSEIPDSSAVISPEDPMYPEWMKDDALAEGPISRLDREEKDFWEKFIKKYEKPDRPLRKQEEIEKQDELKDALIALRNNANFAVWFLNALWILLNYLFQSSNATIGTIDLPPLEAVEPLGLVFLVPFVLVLGVQLIAMFIHRIGVFLQLLSITVIPNPFLNMKLTTSNSKSDKFSMALRLTYDLQQGNAFQSPSEPPVDYDNPSAQLAIGPDAPYDPDVLYRLLQRSRSISQEGSKSHFDSAPKNNISRALRQNWKKMHRRQQDDDREVPSLDRGKGRQRRYYNDTVSNQRSRQYYNQRRPRDQHYKDQHRYHRRHRREDRYPRESHSQRGHQKTMPPHHQSQKSVFLEDNFYKGIRRLSMVPTHAYV